MNPSDIIKYLDETVSQEEKDFLNSPEGKKKYEEFKKMWDETHKELDIETIWKSSVRELPIDKRLDRVKLGFVDPDIKGNKMINNIPFKMVIMGTHIAIPWDSCIPPFYGTYKGILKDGRNCKIDVDWKIKAYALDFDEEQVGTDKIKFWLCDYSTIQSLIENYHRT